MGTYSGSASSADLTTRGHEEIPPVASQIDDFLPSLALHIGTLHLFEVDRSAVLCQEL